MRARIRQTGAAVVAVLVPIVAGCAGGGGEGAETGPASSPGTTAESRSGTGSEADLAELEAIYRARKDSARSRFTEADVRFMTGMIAHHGQALVMARLAPTHGASPGVRRLAARIINAQKDEIATMRAWLRKRGQPVPEIEIEGTTLHVHGAPGDAMQMPGMLTAAQLRELDAARGAEFDRLFLTYMIQHHGGAVTMVHDLFGTDGAALDGAAFKLASDIQVDQRTEIARMERMLESLSGEAGGR